MTTQRDFLLNCGHWSFSWAGAGSRGGQGWAWGLCPAHSALAHSSGRTQLSGLLLLEQHSLLPLVPWPPWPRMPRNKPGCPCSFQEIPEFRLLPGTQAQGSAEPVDPPMDGATGRGWMCPGRGGHSRAPASPALRQLPEQQAGQGAAPAQVTQAVERTCSGSGPGTAFHSLHQDLGLLIPTLHTVVLQAGPPGHSL